MRRQYYSLAKTGLSSKPIHQNFPWSKITLLFLMTSTFLIFATTGASNTETAASWTGHVAEIIAGTTIFSLAAMLLVWAGRMLPKNI